MPRAIGISIHSGWGACVVVGGSFARPEIAASEIVEILEDPERYCYHAAARMNPHEAERWIRRMREKALVNAKRALAPLIALEVKVCAIAARDGKPRNLAETLASHPRIHTAEGIFYRDVFLAACTVPALILLPCSLDIAKVGNKLAGPPWGRDQKIAAAAAWSVLRGPAP